MAVSGILTTNPTSVSGVLTTNLVSLLGSQLAVLDGLIGTCANSDVLCSDWSSPEWLVQDVLTIVGPTGVPTPTLSQTTFQLLVCNSIFNIGRGFWVLAGGQIFPHFFNNLPFFFG